MPHSLRLARRILAVAALAAVAACSGGKPLHTTEGPVDPLFETAASARDDGGRRPFLVQFEDPIDEAAEAALAATGAEVRSYFPDDALLVLASAEEAARARALPEVRAVVPSKPAWRIDPELRAAPPEAVLDVLVELASGDVAGDVEAAIAAAGGTLVEVPAPWLLEARLPSVAVAGLAARGDVLFVAPVPRFEVENDEARAIVAGDGGAQLGPSLADRGLAGQGQLVAVADSGVDADSCFFGGDKIATYEAWDEDAGDESGHGTHVAGSIAGDRRADGIADGWDGIAPAARLHVQDVGTEDGSALDAIPRDLGTLLGSAYDAGARIHSNSWGSTGSTYGPVARSLDLFVAAHPDLLVLVANGNSGPAAGTVGSPATAKNVIAVGASVTADRAARVAGFSSRGPTADGRLKPTLVAPGAGIWSAAADRACAVAQKSGTSMATPVLAGAAAIARQYFVDGHHPSGQADPASGFPPSAALLRATLIAGATPLPDAALDDAGFGLASLPGSLPAAGEARRLWIAEAAPGLRARGVAAYALEVVEPGPLAVALAWTDPAGTSGATKPLVNDLDLELEAPDGTVYRGNVLEAGVSVPGGEADRRNVEEAVRLADAAPGRWTVRVRGANVPRGPQAHALAAIGRLSVPGPMVADEGEAVAVDEGGGGERDGDRTGCATAAGLPGTGILVALAGLLARRRRR